MAEQDPNDNNNNARERLPRITDQQLAKWNVTSHINRAMKKDPEDMAEKTKIRNQNKKFDDEVDKLISEGSIPNVSKRDFNAIREIRQRMIDGVGRGSKTGPREDLITKLPDLALQIWPEQEQQFVNEVNNFLRMEPDRGVDEEKKALIERAEKQLERISRADAKDQSVKNAIQQLKTLFPKIRDLVWDPKEMSFLKRIKSVNLDRTGMSVEQRNSLIDEWSRGRQPHAVKAFVQLLTHFGNEREKVWQGESIAVIARTRDNMEDDEDSVEEQQNSMDKGFKYSCEPLTMYNHKKNRRSRVASNAKDWQTREQVVQDGKSYFMVHLKNIHKQFQQDFLAVCGEQDYVKFFEDNSTPLCVSQYDAGLRDGYRKRQVRIAVMNALDAGREVEAIKDAGRNAWDTASRNYLEETNLFSIASSRVYQDLETMLRKGSLRRIEVNPSASERTLGFEYGLKYDPGDEVQCSKVDDFATNSAFTKLGLNPFWSKEPRAKFLSFGQSGTNKTVVNNRNVLNFPILSNLVHEHRGAEVDAIVEEIIEEKKVSEMNEGSPYVSKRADDMNSRIKFYVSDFLSQWLDKDDNHINDFDFESGVVRNGALSYHEELFVEDEAITDGNMWKKVLANGKLTSEQLLKIGFGVHIPLSQNGSWIRVIIPVGEMEDDVLDVDEDDADTNLNNSKARRRSNRLNPSVKSQPFNPFVIDSSSSGTASRVGASNDVQEEPNADPSSSGTASRVGASNDVQEQPNAGEVPSGSRRRSVRVQAANAIANAGAKTKPVESTADAEESEMETEENEKPDKFLQRFVFIPYGYMFIRSLSYFASGSYGVPGDCTYEAKLHLRELDRDCASRSQNKKYFSDFVHNTKKDSLFADWRFVHHDKETMDVILNATNVNVTVGKKGSRKGGNTSLNGWLKASSQNFNGFVIGNPYDHQKFHLTMLNPVSSNQLLKMFFGRSDAKYRKKKLDAIYFNEDTPEGRLPPCKDEETGAFVTEDVTDIEAGDEQEADEDAEEAREQPKKKKGRKSK